MSDHSETPSVADAVRRPVVCPNRGAANRFARGGAPDFPFSFLYYSTYEDTSLDLQTMRAYLDSPYSQAPHLPQPALPFGLMEPAQEKITLAYRVKLNLTRIKSDMLGMLCDLFAREQYAQLDFLE